MEKAATDELLEQQIHGGDVWAMANQYGFAVEDILDFSANINPLGPSPRALQALACASSHLQHYPEMQGERCLEALSEYLGVPEQRLILGNGAAELIYLAGRMYYQSRLLRLAPTFSEYGQGIESVNYVDFILQKSDGFMLPLLQIQKELQADDVLFIGNPNNPTGKLFPQELMIELANKTFAKSAVLVIDEAFIDFCSDHREQSMRYLVDQFPNVIIIGSLTKFFAIPALRLGYAVAHEQVIGRMKRLLPPWRINLPALLAGEASLRDHDYIRSTLACVFEERSYLAEGLKRIPGLVVWEGDANFLLVNSEGAGLQAACLYQQLSKRGILIRLCHSFANLSSYDFRLAVRKREQNEQLLTALRQIIKDQWR